MIRFRNVMLLVAAAILSACGGGGAGAPPTSLGATGTSPQSVRIADATGALATYTFVDLGAGPNGRTAIAQGANASYQGGNYVSGSGSCGRGCSFNIYHALVWSGPGSSSVDITPPLSYFPEAWVFGGNGSALVGYGITNNAGYYGYPHALLWRGSSFIWKDINPPGDTNSYAYATSGQQIVGSGGASYSHALLWSFSNLAAPTDLNPTGYSQSEAKGIYGSNQVGYALTTSGTPTQHAIMWSGTAASALDLTPANATSASAYGLDSSVEVGCGIVSPATTSHALLWKGTAASMKDLNPTGFIDSCARAVRNGVEVGYGHVSSTVLHALVWTGSAKSAVDLQLSLPSTYSQSEAFTLDSHGNIIGAAFSTTGWHGVMWVRQ